jgi:hypothetical protein
MKKHSFINAAAILVLSSATVMSLFTSCEGPDGIAGVDANETCKQCHNSESVLIAKINQAANSKHQTGITSFENGTSCAPCHTSQGFIERTANDTVATMAVITDPVAINCRTCHTIHTNYDTTDFALRADGPVKLWMGGTLDLGEGSNTCVNCHQSRVVNPMPVSGGANVTIASSRWGVHHGPQSAVLAGLIGYRIAGSVDYPTADHAHKIQAGCVTCHMATAVGSLTGGHTFNMANEEEGDNLVSCKKCHSTAKDFDYENIQTDVEDLLSQLQTILIDKGYLDSVTLLWKASSGTPLVLTPDQAGTLLNYNLIKEDKSMGVHNPDFVKALLQNSIDFWSI